MKSKLLVSLFVVSLFASILAVGLDISCVAAPPVVDGVISPGEYAAGMAVQLVGPYPPGAPFPPWTTDAYIDWDTQYLYVAVNEPVPAPGLMGVKHSWIQFQFEAGSAYHSFVLFDDGTLQYVHYPKPGGPWAWAVWPFPWWAATNTATEFKVSYIEFGIAFGDTIKMSIDRGKDDFLYMPLGEASVWPYPCTYYPTIDVTTWADVTLDHPGPHVVDGVISPGEYAAGMAVQLVGRWDPSWTVDAYIDWDTQYLYVAVNEPVPATSGHLSWIEFAIDAGSARPYLDAFVLFDDGFFTKVQYPKPGGPWGWVPYVFLAASSTATEFRIKYTDFGISLGDTIKMSIDRNQGPAPPLPYGFAAFWPQNAMVYSPPSTDATTWGDVWLAPPPPPQVSLTVVSAYDSPNPSGTTWYTPGTGVTASVTSPVYPTSDTRYVCTDWTGTGDVPGSGTGTTVTFTINQDSGITWSWKTQYYLTVKTDPPGIATILGEGWYDAFATVTLTAPVVAGYVFSYWDFNGVSQGSGVNPITVQVKCRATAHYTAAPPPPVGGEWVPINKVQLLAPWIGLASTMAIAVSFVCFKRVKKRQG